MCAPRTLESWSEAYLGGKKSDNYSEPCNASSDWWEGLHARKVMVTAGGDEEFLDSVTALAKNLKVGASQLSNVLRLGHADILHRNLIRTQR